MDLPIKTVAAKNSVQLQIVVGVSLVVEGLNVCGYLPSKLATNRFLSVKVYLEECLSEGIVGTE